MTYKEIVKILMVIFNGAIFLAGVGILAGGVLVEVGRRKVLEMLNDLKYDMSDLEHLGRAGYFLIAIGAVLTVIGFLGCCGACCENKCMLMTFFIIVLIIFIIEVVGAILVLLNQPKVEKLLNKLRGKVAENIKNTYGSKELVTEMWNEMMSGLRCCGFNNYTDFKDSKFVNDNSLYPKFCCAQSSEKCTVAEASSKEVEGCFVVVVNMIKSKAALLGGVAICVAGVEIAAMAVSCILYKN